MRRLMITVLGAVGLLAALTAPALGQEERVWTGKRWEFRAVKAEAPKAAMMAVAAAEKTDGDVPGVRTVGKNLERAWFRPAAAEATAKGHFCSQRSTTVLKHVEHRHFCRMDGAEKPCPGMNAAGECLAVVK
jgi:hypothetical protein